MFSVFHIQKILNEKYNISVSKGIIKSTLGLFLALFILVLLVSCTDETLQKSDPSVVIDPPIDL